MIHGVNMAFNMLVVVKDSGSIVKEISTKKLVDEENLEYNIHQVDNFTQEKLCCILVVFPFVF